jgi:hypothetical protein
MGVEFGSQEHEDAIARILAAAKSAGKLAAIFCGFDCIRDVAVLYLVSCYLLGQVSPVNNPPNGLRKASIWLASRPISTPSRPPSHPNFEVRGISVEVSGSSLGIVCEEKMVESYCPGV